MTKEHLTFDEAFSRLRRSFLQEVHDFGGSWVDFQHPSIRDMLLEVLKADGTAKMRYIALASARGLCMLIEAVPLYGAAAERTPHKLAISNEQELGALETRVKEVLADTLPPAEVSKVLETAGLLVPKTRGKNAPPAETDLRQLAATPCGRVLASIVRAVAAPEMHESNQAWDISAWTGTLRRFYGLAPYIVPPPRPVYVDLLLRQAAAAKCDDQVWFYGLASRYEPLLFRQSYTSAADAQLAKEIGDRVRKCAADGGDLGKTIFDSLSDEYNANDEWRDDADDVLALADRFYGFSAVDPPTELELLRDLYENHDMPDEPEAEDLREYEPDDWGSGDAGSSWTIEGLFSDL